MGQDAVLCFVEPNANIFQSGKDDSSGLGQRVCERGTRDGTLHGLPCN